MTAFSVDWYWICVTSIASTSAHTSGGTNMNRFITNHWFGLAVVALVFLLFASRVASGQNIVPDRSPTYLSGYLACAENEDGTRYCPFRLHYVELEKNRTYMIRMESSDF